MRGLAMLLAVAGTKLKDLPETRGDLLAALQGTPAALRFVHTSRSEIEALATSPDGRLAADADPQVVARIGAGFDTEIATVLGWSAQQTEPMVLARLTPPERAGEAHRRLEAGGTRGRLVIAF